MGVSTPPKLRIASATAAASTVSAWRTPSASTCMAL